MSFGIALSGLDAAQSDLNVTANNIANAGTTGFKSSTAQFSELFSAAAQGVSHTQVGGGVQLTDVQQQFSQGDIQTTGNSLDMALNGNGFFTVSDAGSTQYTRAGSFTTNADGYVVNSQGQFLQVYAPTASGQFNTTSLNNLQIPTGDSAPAASTQASMVFNLPANSTPPANSPFSPTDSNSYNQSTSLTLYDSLGAAHTASFYFVNTGAGAWNAYEYIDGAQVNSTPVQLTYGSSGALTAVKDAAGGTNPQAISFGTYTPTTGGAAMKVAYNLASTTQYGDQFGVTSETQDGYTTGQLSGVSVSSTGVVQAKYTNGQSKALGQVAIANFADQQGLQQVDNTNWVQTFMSGPAVYGQAGGAGVGMIQSGAVENSNVDITTQLVNMITAQRAFQANAEMVSTENQITQTVIGIPTQA
jgi:flagellar hook protein FlgE